MKPTLALKLMTPKLDVLKLAPSECLPDTRNILDMKCIRPVGATQTRMDASPSIDLFIHSRLALKLTVHDNKGDLTW